MRTQSPHHHLPPKRNQVTTVISSKASSANSPPSSRKTISLKKSKQRFKQRRKIRLNQRRACSLDSKNRSTKMKQTVRRQRKSYWNISMQWTSQTKAYLIEKQKDLCKSKMMSMLLMLTLAQMSDVLGT